MNIEEKKEKLVIAKKCAQSLWFFTRYFFKKRNNFKFIPNWHHIRITNALTKVYNGEIKRLIINMPPRYGKTEISVINFPAWCLARNPDCKFIHTSYSKDLAINNSAQIRELIKSEYYQELFKLQLKGDSDAKHKWDTITNGGMYAVGSGGAITGFGAGLAREGFGGAIIIDDPHKPNECDSDVMRNNVIDWYQNTVQSRVNSPNTPIIIIMQRLHLSDLAGWLLDGGTKEKWEHLCLPAISDDGKPLWEYKHSAADLNRLDQANSYVFSGQYLQRPIPSGGAIFKTENIKIVDAIPANILFIVRAWDKAGSQDAGDFTAGVKMGMMSDGRYIVLDSTTGQWKADKRESIIKNTAIMDGRNVRIRIEQEGGSGGKESAENTIKNLAGFAIDSMRPTGNKTDRANPFACQLNIGNVLLLKGEWNTSYVNELKNFPKAAHDDQVDASSCAFNLLALGKRPNATTIVIKR